MFNFGDNVDCDKVERAGDSRLSTNDDKVESRRLQPCRVSTLLPVYTGLYVFVQEVV